MAKFGRMVVNRRAKKFRPLFPIGYTSARRLRELGCEYKDYEYICPSEKALDEAIEYLEPARIDYED